MGVSPIIALKCLSCEGEETQCYWQASKKADRSGSASKVVSAGGKKQRDQNASLGLAARDVGSCDVPVYNLMFYSYSPPGCQGEEEGTPTQRTTQLDKEWMQCVASVLVGDEARQVSLQKKSGVPPGLTSS
ncbi:hypothetical protein Pmani_032100 [Petrolisthes manimaculis]|uniref:Uncharacterized protein n=1 Tax=Petrolisthes manimaculis TaxID=1843537 RepID=A0AAE1TRR7_9EUCA|nr:hypothetical protein Pmani_032100 [Petrolisthes manimaculis]